MKGLGGPPCAVLLCALLVVMTVAVVPPPATPWASADPGHRSVPWASGTLLLGWRGSRTVVEAYYWIFRFTDGGSGYINEWAFAISTYRGTSGSSRWIIGFTNGIYVSGTAETARCDVQWLGIVLDRYWDYVPRNGQATPTAGSSDSDKVGDRWYYTNVQHGSHSHLTCRSGDDQNFGWINVYEGVTHINNLFCFWCANTWRTSGNAGNNWRYWWQEGGGAADYDGLTVAVSTSGGTSSHTVQFWAWYKIRVLFECDCVFQNVVSVPIP